MYELFKNLGDWLVSGEQWAGPGRHRPPPRRAPPVLAARHPRRRRHRACRSACSSATPGAAPSSPSTSPVFGRALPTVGLVVLVFLASGLSMLARLHRPGRARRALHRHQHLRGDDRRRPGGAGRGARAGDAPAPGPPPGRTAPRAPPDHDRAPARAHPGRRHGHHRRVRLLRRASAGTSSTASPSATSCRCSAARCWWRSSPSSSTSRSPALQRTLFRHRPAKSAQEQAR